MSCKLSELMPGQIQSTKGTASTTTPSFDTKGYSQHLPYAGKEKSPSAPALLMREPHWYQSNQPLQRAVLSLRPSQPHEFGFWLISKLAWTEFGGEGIGCPLPLCTAGVQQLPALTGTKGRGRQDQVSPSIGRVAVQAVAHGLKATAAELWAAARSHSGVCCSRGTGRAVNQGLSPQLLQTLRGLCPAPCVRTGQAVTFWRCMLPPGCSQRALRTLGGPEMETSKGRPRQQETVLGFSASAVLS